MAVCNFHVSGRIRTFIDSEPSPRVPQSNIKNRLSLPITDPEILRAQRFMNSNGRHFTHFGSAIFFEPNIVDFGLPGSYAAERPYSRSRVDGDSGHFP